MAEAWIKPESIIFVPWSAKCKIRNCQRPNGGSKNQRTLSTLQMDNTPSSYDAGMEESQRLKREADGLYGNGSYGEAIEKYGEAQVILSNISGTAEELRKCRIMRVFVLQNLAACHIKLGIPAVAASLCADALEIDPSNTKTLERRAQCFSDIGEYVGAYRDIIRLRELGSVSADVQKLAAEIERKAPEAVMMVTEEASRKLTPSIGGKGVLSGLFRVYLTFYAGLMSLLWFIAVVIVLLAILHGAIADTPEEGWNSARESIIKFLPLLWVLLVADCMDVLHGVFGWEGKDGAGDGFLSLAFRRFCSVFVAQYLIFPNYDDLEGWSTWGCIITWTLLGICRYPLKIILYINPSSHATVVSITSQLYIAIQPLCMLSEYTVLWKSYGLAGYASPTGLGSIEASTKYPVEFLVIAYPILSAIFYHFSLRIFSLERKEAAAAAGRVKAKPAVYKM